jgi:hypothetical protein
MNAKVSKAGLAKSLVKKLTAKMTHKAKLNDKLASHITPRAKNCSRGQSDALDKEITHAVI